MAEDRFRVLMIIAAAAVAFAHGANDVANAIGPFTAVVDYHRDKQIDKDGTLLEPKNIWILFLGAFFIVFGLATFGHRVIETVGSKICALTFTKGFVAQISAALTVMIATIIGMPVSSTSALIGAIAGVGLTEMRSKLLTDTGVDVETDEHNNISVSQQPPSKTGVDSKMLMKIAASWVFSLVSAGILAAIIYIIAVEIYE